MRKHFSSIPLCLLLWSGCATGVGSSLLGTKPLEVPPEFNQKVQLKVSDEYTMHQAPVSHYDVGDLESFHIQHTLPVTIEEMFREIFGQVEIVKDEGPKIETERPDVPAIFEVRMIDAANDTFIEGSDHYRGEVTLAVAMKSPRDEIFWQQAFRGQGYVRVDDQFSQHLGPNDALVDALRDAVDQMQDGIINSQAVRLQLKYYKQADEERKKRETPPVQLELPDEKQKEAE